MTVPAAGAPVPLADALIAARLCAADPGLGGIALRGGGAIVFGLLERTDTITLRPGGKSLTPSADFQRLVRKKTLTKSAELKSYETVVFTVPAVG